MGDPPTALYAKPVALTVSSSVTLCTSLLCLLVLQLESLNQSELASRLTLNCQNSYVEPHKIKDVAVTIIDVSVEAEFS